MKPFGHTARLCAAVIFPISLAACGMIPRSDYAPGATVDRVYPVELNKLAGCAFDRLDQNLGTVRKVDFPDRKAVKLGHNTPEGMYVWEANFTAEGPKSTRVSIPMPAMVGKIQPERIFEIITPCAS